MRILHTEWSDGWGGQEHRVLYDLKGMAARGHEVLLVAREQSRIRHEAQSAGIPVMTLALRRATDVGSVAALCRMLRERKVDVANTHSGVDSWIGGLAAKLARTPVLLRTRHLNLPLKRNWVNFVHYLPDCVITCGDAMRRQLIETNNFPSERVVSIPTGIDLDAFQPKRPRVVTRQELGLAENDFAVLMVGIIRHVKGHDVALSAFQILNRQNSQAKLILAGDGPMQDHIKKLARDLGIAGSVQFLGFRNDVADLMRAADVLLLTSRSEGVPQSVTQALSLGLPVVATDVGGVRELIEHERSGLLVPSEDPTSTAGAMNRILHEPEIVRRFRETGHAHVIANYSLQAMLDKTERLCAELISRKRQTQS